jgi:hypothetical protein
LKVQYETRHAPSAGVGMCRTAGILEKWVSFPRLSFAEVILGVPTAGNRRRLTLNGGSAEIRQQFLPGLRLLAAWAALSFGPPEGKRVDGTTATLGVPAGFNLGPKTTGRFEGSL